MIRKFVPGVFQLDKYSTFTGSQSVYVVTAAERIELCEKKKREVGVKMAPCIIICFVSSNGDHLTAFFCRQFCLLCGFPCLAAEAMFVLEFNFYDIIVADRF